MNEPRYNAGAIDASACISNGWELIKPNYWMYFGITILTMLMVSCIPCVNFFIAGPVMGGLYFVFLRDMRGEPVDFGMMFKGFEKFLPLMIVGIVQSVPEIIAQILRITVDLGRLGLMGNSESSNAGFAMASGMMVLVALAIFVFVIIGVVWRVLLIFAIPLVMEHNLNPVAAMKLSAQAAMSNLGGLILLFILEFLIGMLGVIMLCVGIFFVMPILYAANAFAYRQVFPMVENIFQNIPPPPDTYDGNFGRGM